MSGKPAERLHRKTRDRPASTGRHTTASGRRQWSRAALIAGGILTAAIAVSAGFAAAGGHGLRASLSSGGAAPTNAPVTQPSPSASASASASAPWSSASCPSQLASWRSTGAGGQLQVVVTDLTIVSQAAVSLDADLASGTAPSAALTALRSAARSLRSSTRAAGKNLIPGCALGAYRVEVAGLADLGDAVAGFDNAVGETGSGDYGTAQRGMRTAITAMQSGSAEMAKTTADLNRYGIR